MTSMRTAAMVQCTAQNFYVNVTAIQKRSNIHKGTSLNTMSARSSFSACKTTQLSMHLMPFV